MARVVLTIANLDIVGSQEALLVQGGDLNGTAQPFGTTANPYNSAISLASGTSVRNVNIGGDGTAAVPAWRSNHELQPVVLSSQTQPSPI